MNNFIYQKHFKDCEEVSQLENSLPRVLNILAYSCWVYQTESSADTEWFL